MFIEKFVWVAIIQTHVKARLPRICHLLPKYLNDIHGQKISKRTFFEKKTGTERRSTQYDIYSHYFKKPKTDGQKVECYPLNTTLKKLTGRSRKSLFIRSV